MGAYLSRLQGGFGPGRIAAMGVVALALAAFFAFIIIRATTPDMTPLFTELTLEDSSAILKELDAQSVPYELRGNGAAILVPADQAARLRMKLAEKRLPTGGGVGWEIFDRGDGFSATSFVQNVNHLRALEGEIARSIASLSRVAAARVHLVVPERPLFTRDAPQPSASIVIRARGELDGGEVRAIRHLVASAVQGLKPEKVSLVDERGKLLADGAEGEDGSASSADEKAAALEKRLRERIEAIVGRVVGPDRARVEVRAEIDRTKSTLTAENYDPESKVVRSTQTREESAQSSEPAEQGVTVGAQLPGAQKPAAGAQPRDASNKSEEVVNYEISRTTRTEVQDGGRLKRLSVAVLVVGVYARAANGDMSYAPRPQEELDRISALVRAGVGFDQARGDALEVVNLRFADIPGAGEAPLGPESWFDLTRADVMRFIELGVLVLVSALVLLIVVRPLLKRVLAPEAAPTLALGTAAAASGGLIAAAGPDGAPYVPGQPQQVTATGTNGGITVQQDGTQIALAVGETGRHIAAAEIAGRMKAESIEKIGELVRGNPVQSAAVIRQWLQEPA